MTTPHFMEASHPDFLAEQQEALDTQLLTTAKEIEALRTARVPVPSQNAWVKEWPGLGSQKTYSKILSGELEDVNTAAKLPDYRGVLRAILADQKGRAAEVLYDDLPGAQAAILAALRLMHHHGKDRLLLIQGGSGSGKTSVLDLLAKGAAAGALVRVEANDTWKSERVAMRDILLGLGDSLEKVEAMRSGGEMLARILEILERKGRILLAIDEAHHCTGRVLNLLKTLLNKSEVLLVMAGMNTLLQKLRANASEEAKQLIHNRLFQSVNLGGPDGASATAFLRRRMGVTTSWKAGTLTTLTETARHCGHWSFLRRVVDHLRMNGANQPDDADLLSAVNDAAREIA
jgi:DNA transposition AAA+ family ATPase